MQIKTISKSGNAPKIKEVGFTRVFFEETYTNTEKCSISFDDYEGVGKDYKKRDNMKIEISKGNNTIQFDSPEAFIEFIFDKQIKSDLIKSDSSRKTNIGKRLPRKDFSSLGGSKPYPIQIIGLFDV